MFSNKKRILALTMAALILVLSFGTTGYATTVQSTLKAQFKALKILLNGSQITMESQPIVVNGTTYLPLRAFANLFNKNVEWNATLQQVSITDQVNNEVEGLKAQIAEKDNQILILQAQLTAKSGDRSLSDMEDQLNDDYKDYENLAVDITLSGTKSKVTVKVDVGSKTKWNALSTTKKTKLLQNITDDLDDEYDDPTISGTVKAGSTTISSFSVNSSGTVKLVSSSGDLGDLEDDLNSDYDSLEDIDDLNIVLDGDEDEITFTVEIAYEDFDSDWDDLTNSEIENYMKDIKEAIEDAVDDNDYDLEDYDRADVKGYIVNTDDSDDKMATLSDSGTFNRDSSYPAQ